MTKTKNKKSLLLTIFMFLLFIASSVVVSVSIASEGSIYLALEDEIAKVESENRQLKAELVKEGSLTKVSEKVKELELKRPEKIIYIR